MLNHRGRKEGTKNTKKRLCVLCAYFVFSVLRIFDWGENDMHYVVGVANLRYPRKLWDTDDTDRTDYH